MYPASSFDTTFLEDTGNMTKFVPRAIAKPVKNVLRSLFVKERTNAVSGKLGPYDMATTAKILERMPVVISLIDTLDYNP